MHNSSLGCYPKLVTNELVFMAKHCPLNLTIVVHGAAVPSSVRLSAENVDQGLLCDIISSDCAFSIFLLHITKQDDFDCFTLANGYYENIRCVNTLLQILQIACHLSYCDACFEGHLLLRELRIMTQNLRRASSW